MSKKSLWQVIKYALFSVSAGIIQAISYTLLLQVVFGGRENWHWLCNVIATVLSVLWNFTLNRKYTFGSANNIPIAMLKVACFYLVFIPASTLSQRLVNVGWNAFLVEALVMVCNFVLEFLYFKFVVFREKKAEQEKV